MSLNRLPRLRIGPGALVAAAFIGPGTVTACTVAGANFGFALIWALAFATIATIVLQEMSARLGVVTGRGLGSVMITTTGNVVVRRVTIGLVLAALYVGNAAYEAGNLSGASLGIETATGGRLSFRYYVAIVTALAAILLLRGGYKTIERVLIGLVIVMCVAFLVTIVVIKPDIAQMLAGLRPQIPAGGLTTVLALIGTTVVPYNLFLHAAAARNRFQGEGALRAARMDTVISVGLGGVISILILSTAAAGLFASGIVVSNAADMAQQLQPAFGNSAKWLVALGLFAAGLSSAVTAPLATAYAVSECLQWQVVERGRAFRGVAMSVLLIGAGVSLLGLKPVAVILFAQMANGLLLPIVAVFLLLAMNRRALLGDHVNSTMANVTGVAVVLVAVILGSRLIWRAIGL